MVTASIPPRISIHNPEPLDARRQVGDSIRERPRPVPPDIRGGTAARWPRPIAGLPATDSNHRSSSLGGRNGSRRIDPFNREMAMAWIADPRGLPAPAHAHAAGGPRDGG